MTIHELFQSWYADQHGLLASDISLLQMRNGSYATAAIATAFRAFKAGYEANKTGFTAVDMATATADGFRDGRASVVIELPRFVGFEGAYDSLKTHELVPSKSDIEDADEIFSLVRTIEVREAIEAAGGSVKQ